jgi:hypothetical protein
MVAREDRLASEEQAARDAARLFAHLPELKRAVDLATEAAQNQGVGKIAAGR